MKRTNETQIKRQVWLDYLMNLNELMPEVPTGDVLNALDISAVALAKATGMLGVVPEEIRQKAENAYNG